MGPNSSLTFHLALSLLYCLGLGHAGMTLLQRWPRRPAPVDETRMRPALAARAVSMRLGLGILVHGLAVMMGLPLRVVLYVGSAVALVGVGIGIRWLWRTRSDWAGYSVCAAWILLGLSATGVGAWAMLMDALWANDARSVWFFHAKIIYYAGALRSDGGWLEPAISFSHPEYPKLMPILAATEMIRFGYWNEFVPKLGFVPPLACTLLAFLAGPRGRASVSAAAIMVVAFLMGGPIIHNGYVDAYVALSTAGALMAALRWLRSGDARDAQHAFILVGMGLATKEEGFLFAIALLVVLLFLALTRRMRAHVRTAFGHPVTIIVAVLAVAPWAVWGLLMRRWKLHGYFEVNAAAMARAWSRARGGALSTITAHLLGPGSRWFDLVTTRFVGFLAAAGVVKLVALAASRRLQLPGVLCVVTGACYFAMLCLIFLMTPFDFGWQLGASADRVMLVTFGCVLVFLGDALEDIEWLSIPRWAAVSLPGRAREQP
jgi:hypothetical protein